MFSSLIRTLQMNFSNMFSGTNSVQNTNTLEVKESAVSPTQALINLARSSSNSVVKALGDIIASEPYAGFLLIVMIALIITLMLRWTLYITGKKALSSKKFFWRRVWTSLSSPQFLWSGLILGVILGLDVLNLPEAITHVLRIILFSILLWLLYIVSRRILSVYSRAILIYHSSDNKIKFFRNKNVFIVFSRITRAAWTVIFITVLLGLWGVQLGPILAGLGIAGLVVGFALQDALSHVFGGISLMLDETYTEGDYVILENGNEGIIFQIGYRSTKLRTFNEEIIIIPNGILAKMVITNLSQPVKRMRVVIYYTTHASDASPETVKELLVQATNKVTGVLRYPEPYVFFLEPKGTTYRFRLNYFIPTAFTRLSSTDAVHMEVVKIFRENNIRFAAEESLIQLERRNFINNS